MSPRPVRADDLLRFRVPSDVQIAPDGRSVVWPERWIDAEKSKVFSNLFLARDGEAPRAFTSGRHVDSGVRFSPDGSQLAFLRTIPGQTPPRQQLCVLPTGGGESRVLLDEPGRYLPPAWSPDGRTLVVPFRADDVLPEGETEPLAIRVTRIQYKMDGQGYLPQDRFHLYRVDVAAEKPARVALTGGDADDTDPTFSPDGSRIAFLSGRRDERDLENRDLFVVPAAGGEPTRLKHGRGECSAPAWSPDGQWLVAAAQCGEKTVGLVRGRLELFRFHVDGRPEESLTPDVDRCPINLTIDDVWGLDHMGRAPAVTPDGRRVFFPLTDSGQTYLCALDLDASARRVGPLRRVVEDRHVVTYAIAPAAGRMAILTTHPTSPGQIHVCDLEARERTLVGWPMRSWCEEVALREPEELRVETPDGATIQGWLLTPQSPPPWPLLLDIHGGPIVQFGRTFFHEHQTWAGRGYAVLYVNPRGSQGYGVEHSKPIHRDWGTKPLVDLMAAVDHVCRSGRIDEKRMGVMGGSYGGYMTNWVVAHTNRFKAACTQRTVASMEALIWSDFGAYWGEEHGAWPWDDPELYARMAPITYAKKIETPMLILQSLGDQRTPADQGERLYVTLRVLGKVAEMVLFPGSDHNLSRSGPVKQRLERLRVLDEWFGRHLGVPPA